MDATGADFVEVVNIVAVASQDPETAVATALVDAGLESISALSEDKQKDLVSGDARTVALNVMRAGRSELESREMREHGNIRPGSTAAIVQSVVDKALNENTADPVEVEHVIEYLKMSAMAS
eukprot:jgi/Botrbrau1/15207/Bobra.0149s0066.1